MTWPLGSVNVTIVLLNVAWICACPRGIDLRSRRLGLPDVDFFLSAILAIPSQRYFLAVALFLPATVLFGPRRVRAFVRVRCPRTGRVRRWCLAPLKAA